MIKVYNKIKRLVNQVLGVILPQPLPVGMAQFNDYVDRMAATYDLPTKDKDSVVFTVATAIMHLGATEARKAPFYFVRIIRAAASKQVASASFQEVKLKQIEAAQKKQEATSTEKAASVDQSLPN